MDGSVTMTTKSLTPLLFRRQQRAVGLLRSCSVLSIWSLLILLITCQSQIVSALNLEQCIDPLGMENGDIPDSAITASSSFDLEQVGPQHARIRKERNGGAWCPTARITESVKEYLQIDLGELRVITKLETQGRFGNGLGREYAAFYYVEYQREDGGDWIQFRNSSNSEIFEGNSNSYIAVTRDVNPPFIARRIRFVPYSVTPRTVCMRVEMYGCSWNDCLVTYSMPEGHRWGQDLDLVDITYDGDLKPNYLSNGLGQLTDGEVGETNFRMDTKKIGIKGYEWVGWKNDSSNSKPVSILFKFDSVRNFSHAVVHCNNEFTQGVRVFRQAELFYSIGGTYFSPQTTRVNIQRDDYFEYARSVTLRMPGKIGRFVRMDLYFQAEWLMISEVSFTSTPAVGDFPKATPSPSDQTPLPTDRTPLPTDRTPLPTDRTPLPTDRTPLPTDRTPLPTDRTPLPTERTPLPADPPPSPADRTPSPTSPTSTKLVKEVIPSIDYGDTPAVRQTQTFSTAATSWTWTTTSASISNTSTEKGRGGGGAAYNHASIYGICGCLLLLWMTQLQSVFSSC